jgi:deoxyribodipyrimidine photolyase
MAHSLLTEELHKIADPLYKFTKSDYDNLKRRIAQVKEQVAKVVKMAEQMQSVSEEDLQRLSQMTDEFFAKEYVGSFASLTPWTLKSEITFLTGIFSQKGGTNLKTLWDQLSNIEDSIEQNQNSLFTLYDPYYEDMRQLGKEKADLAYSQLKQRSIEDEIAAIESRISIKKKQLEAVKIQSQEERNRLMAQADKEMEEMTRAIEERQKAFEAHKRQLEADQQKITQDFQARAAALQQQIVPQ